MSLSFTANYTPQVLPASPLIAAAMSASVSESVNAFSSAQPHYGRRNAGELSNKCSTRLITRSIYRVSALE